MNTSSRGAAYDAFSIREIARAAHVSEGDVRAAIATRGASCARGFVPGPEAVSLVRLLRRTRTNPSPPAPLTAREMTPKTPQRRSLSLLCSGSLHALLLVALLAANWLGLLSANQTTVDVKDSTPAHLVFLISPGPGGGGGGGGLQIPIPPARERVKAPVIRKVTSVPPPVKRSTPPPPPSTPTPPVAPPVPPPVKPEVVTPARTPAPAAIQAPVAPVAADRIDAPGTLTATPNPTTSPGPGTGGGAGTGNGTGLGEGHGPGLGDGSGGGTGGGPYGPGSGIEPPTLINEVRPDYTPEARKRAIEGDVGLEIVVRRDGTVGSIKVLQTLGGGLEQRAIDAVRQWRFAPARQHGAAVDVVATVSVGFKLR